MNIKEIEKQKKIFFDFYMNSYYKKDLSPQAKNAIIPFLDLGYKHIRLFDNESDEKMRLQHFASLYSFATLHYKHLFAQCEELNSLASHTRQFTKLGTWIESQYVPGLKSWLSGVRSIFREYANTYLSGDNSNYLIKIEGTGDAINYKLHADIENQMEAPANTLVEMQNRAMIMAYIDLTKDDAALRVTGSRVLTAGVCMGGLLLLGPVSFVATCAASAYANSKITEQPQETMRSLSRRQFQKCTQIWGDQINELFDDEKKMQLFLEKSVSNEFGYRARKFLDNLAEFIA